MGKIGMMLIALGAACELALVVAYVGTSGTFASAQHQGQAVFLGLGAILVGALLYFFDPARESQ